MLIFDILNVILMNVFMLLSIRLLVVILNVIMLIIDILNVIMLAELPRHAAEF
jgi:hypothetical protein